MKRIRTAAIFLALTLSSHLYAVPEHSPVPGGVYILPLTGIEATKTPNAWYRSNRVMVINSEGSQYEKDADWLAVVGIPLKAKPSNTQKLVANGIDYNFEIQGKEYKAQYLTIKNKKHVNPDPKQVERWRREKAEMIAAYKSWTMPTKAITELQLPAKGPFSSPFGLKRFFNKQPRNPHSGLDIAAPIGAPITAPAAGIVVAKGDYFFNGKTLIIDHGHGLATMYCHMSEMTAKLGDQVKAGDLIGKIGKTGRVTGPHLHWSVSLNNTRVDPLLFVDSH